MVEGPILLLILLLGIATIVLLTSKLKLHPFISLILVAYGIAFAAGLPADKIGSTITEGFGGILGGIGIVIIFGTIIGTILEKSGAAVKMADVIVRVVGDKHPALAMSIIGYIVSIPVFCDSGFVILSPLKRALKKKTGASAVAMTVALSTGLYATHTLVPPTPGPIAAAANLGLDHNLLLVILFGLFVAIPSVIAGYLYAASVGKKIKSQEDIEETMETYEEVIAKFGKLPNAFLSFAPIVLPIIFMALGSIAKFPGDPFGTGFAKTLFVFLGTPVNALGAGLLASLPLLPNFKESILSGWVNEGLQSSAIIIMVTGAGGSLGKVLAATNIGTYLGETLATLNIGILLPFIIAAALKTAQGSSTVALVTTSALVAPLLTTLGLDGEIARVLVVMAIGAGSMTVSHANDSYFWVVTQFSGQKVDQAYKSQTVATLIQGLVTMATVYILSFIFI